MIYTTTVTFRLALSRKIACQMMPFLSRA